MPNTYAICLHPDGNIEIVDLGVEEDGAAEFLRCSDIDLFTLDAEKMPLAESYGISFDAEAREGGDAPNALASSLCGFDDAKIYGDAILQPCIFEDAKEHDINMPYELAEILTLVCYVYRQAMEEGTLDELPLKRERV